MQLKDFWAALLRRWYLVLLSIVCAAAAAYLVVTAVGPTYKAQASVLLLPPGTTVQRNSESTGVGNPWLSLGGVSQARDVVIRALMSSATHEALCEKQGDEAYRAMQVGLCGAPSKVSYEVTQDYMSSAPMILVTVEADSAANAVTAVNEVANLVPITLADLQASLQLKPRALITSMPVVIDRNPTVVRKDQIRAGIVAAGGTLGVALLLIGLLDGLLIGRRGRREQVIDDRAIARRGRREQVNDSPATPRRGRREQMVPEPPFEAAMELAEPWPDLDESAHDELHEGQGSTKAALVSPIRKHSARAADRGDSAAANE